MAFEQKELSGSLFRNTYKSKPSQPDHRGSCKIGDEEYDISAWVKDGKSGKFFSLAFQKKFVKENDPSLLFNKDDGIDTDEDIPF
tara:strand:- start:323 stop:577 length:255 start_codon:yes stop_codon:yes gene_type:complete